MYVYVCVFVGVYVCLYVYVYTHQFRKCIGSQNKRSDRIVSRMEARLKNDLKTSQRHN